MHEIVVFYLYQDPIVSTQRRSRFMVTKKTTTKKSAPKSSKPKKATPKKAAPKKAATKTTAAKKSVAKKTTPKKTKVAVVPMATEEEGSKGGIDVPKSSTR
jgi:hypothetical protein